ncbi:hypothetical protein ACMYSQ_008949 [Aspergillus niger]
MNNFNTSITAITSRNQTPSDLLSISISTISSPSPSATMYFPLAFATFVFSALALPTGGNHKALPACDATPRPCSCPTGTFLQNSTSWATWPVPAKGISDITANFFETAWFGTSPSETHGEPYTPGAERVLYGELPNAGVYPMTEELRTFKWLPRNKGYQLTFGLADVPFYYNTTSGPAGQLGGTWEWMDVHAIGKKETYMLWNIHACFSSAYDFAGFHESAMNNITAILKAEGKMTGEMNGPYSY